MKNNNAFDWQGHRGARGLMPENTLIAFLTALRFPVKTLELDVVISADSQVIVSHEPWFSARICTPPADLELTEANEKQFRILQYTRAQIRAFDCGSKKHPSFPNQQNRPTHKPALSEVVEAVRAYCQQNNREFPQFNIELKSRPEWDDILTPRPETFSQLLIQELDRLKITSNCIIQSFDVRILKNMHQSRPEIRLALLIDAQEDGELKLQELGFMPAIYSPQFRQLTRERVEELHRQQLKVIPWTVNDLADMEPLLDMGVDGIITDYPNLIPLIEKTGISPGNN